MRFWTLNALLVFAVLAVVLVPAADEAAPVLYWELSTGMKLDRRGDLYDVRGQDGIAYTITRPALRSAVWRLATGKAPSQIAPLQKQ